MKSLTAILLSFTMIFSLGTAALAEPGEDALMVSAPGGQDSALEEGDLFSEDNGSEDDSSSMETGGTPQEDLTDEAGISDGSDEDPGFKESGEPEEGGTDGAQDEIAGEEADEEFAEGGETKEEEGEEQYEELTEDELTEDEESEEEEDEEEDEDEEEEDEEAGIALLSFSVKDYVNLEDLESLTTLKYDDRYDLSSYSQISSGESYTILMDAKSANISSCQVVNGEISQEPDVSLLAQESAGSTSVIASGVGSADFYIIRTEDLKKLEELEEENSDTDEPYSVEPASAEPLTVSLDPEDYDIVKEEPEEYVSDGSVEENTVDGNSEEWSTDIVTADNGTADIVTLAADEIPDEDKVNVYRLSVTVGAAPLTLMFLAGQSNMEGQCSDSTGYEIDASIACKEGDVYSTYMPSTATRGKNITGISISAGTASTSGNYVAGSLQGTVTSSEKIEDGDSSYVISGTLEDPSNMSGGTLTYPLNSLTSAGGGKTGPDSGLAYEWNQETGDKVWVINTAYGSTSISDWVSGGTCYERSRAVWNNVLETYSAEVGNHYTAGEKLVFWLQGETDKIWSAEDYELYFADMYSSIEADLNPTAIGIIMVRASKGSYTSEEDLKMTGPRIAQYWLGSSSVYSDVYVVSNANEQWVSDSGVKSYFQSAYPNGFDYPMQGASKSVPTTVSAVHGDIHYSQIGHNENGITAAKGMYQVLYGSTAPSSISWKDESGQTVTSIDFEYSDDTAIAVPVASPVYSAKQISCSVSGSSVSYSASTGIISGKATGTTVITASGGGKSADLSVKVATQVDLTGEAGKNYDGFYKYNGSYWYLKNGIVQKNVTSVIKDTKGVVGTADTWWYVEKGKVDKTYTGFATNSNGKWYIESGKVTFNKNSVIKDTTGAIGTKGTWYYVVGSKVQTDFTGLANYKNSNGWWYIKKGVVDFTANGVYKNQNGWYYVDGGKVQFGYDGFGTNNNGSWYIEGGKVRFDKNSVIKDTTGALGTKGTWYYVVGSKVQYDFTGLANYKNENGWWYIKKGVVDFTVNGVYKNKNGWYYVTGGKVQFGFTGLAHYKNANGWWYIKGGKVDFTASGVYKNQNGWYYVTGGKVDFSFNGIAKNSNGWWYIKGGKVDFSFTGTVKVSGVTYSVTKGKVAY